jgi:hypothetical protein
MEHTLPIPSLHSILTQVGWKPAEITKYFPHLTALTSLDVRQAFVLQRLHRLLAESITSATPSTTRNSVESAPLLTPHMVVANQRSKLGQTLSLSPGGKVLSQVILTHYTLWLRDAIRRNNCLLGQYVRDEIEQHCDCLLSSGGGSGGGGSGSGRGGQSPRFSSPGGGGGALGSSSSSSSRESTRHDSSVVASAAWSALCYRHICSERYLTHDSQTILHLLLLLLSSQASPLTRARCMKALGALVRTDASLLHLPRMEELVLERFNDVSISVREETVKLVGKYLLSLRSMVKLESAEDVSQKKRDEAGTGAGAKAGAWSREEGGSSADSRYLNGLLVRLRDKGVSVRKSVAHTLREILLHQPGHPRYTELCR